MSSRQLTALEAGKITGLSKFTKDHFFFTITFVASDISLIYHIIRGQGTIKLYVVYNVLEVKTLFLYDFIGLH